MSTRVLPEPAGAMTRAGPPSRGRRRPAGRRRGRRPAPALRGRGRSDPSSTDSACTSDLAGRRRASRAAVDPRRPAVGAGATSPALVRGVDPTAPVGEPGRLGRPTTTRARRRGRRRCWPTPGSGGGRTTARSTACGVHGSPAIDSGVRKRAGSTASSTTTSRRRDHASYSRATTPPGASSAGSSIRTTAASAHASGGGDPASSTTPLSESMGRCAAHARARYCGAPRPAAIWSLCVSYGDLVTQVLDIEGGLTWCASTAR